MFQQQLSCFFSVYAKYVCIYLCIWKIYRSAYIFGKNKQYLEIFVLAKSVQSCLILCNPMDNSLPGFSVHWILQARILSGLLFPSPGDLPDSGTEPTSPGSLALAGRFFRTRATWEIFVDINKSKLHYKKQELYHLINHLIKPFYITQIIFPSRLTLSFPFCGISFP